MEPEERSDINNQGVVTNNQNVIGSNQSGQFVAPTNQPNTPAPGTSELTKAPLASGQLTFQPDATENRSKLSNRAIFALIMIGAVMVFAGCGYFAYRYTSQQNAKYKTVKTKTETKSEVNSNTASSNSNQLSSQPAAVTNTNENSNVATNQNTNYSTRSTTTRPRVVTNRNTNTATVATTPTSTEPVEEPIAPPPAPVD